jgi:hypothetical protein
MGSHPPKNGVVSALLGFIGGYLTALVQMRGGDQARLARANRTIAMLNGLVQKYARTEAPNDEAAP